MFCLCTLSICMCLSSQLKEVTCASPSSSSSCPSQVRHIKQLSYRSEEKLWPICTPLLINPNSLKILTLLAISAISSVRKLKATSSHLCDLTVILLLLLAFLSCTDTYFPTACWHASLYSIQLAGRA